ncbi:MAG TPA: 50S ribosomal protein L24 [Candidatus Moranbacteria bacterium]|nr:50S ribosomal protein L24 [Candidatus Moranbacteria bacterium]
MKIKKNDIVKMLAGKDRGKTGKVLSVFSEEGKVVVENLNIVKKHNRPKREGEKGQRVEVPRRITVSNVMLVCPKCGKTTRVGYEKSGNGKMRICKKCKSEV